MTHKTEALFQFLCAEHASDQLNMFILSSKTMQQIVAKKENKTPEQLKKDLYKTYTDLGFEHAKGEFKLLFVDEA